MKMRVFKCYSSEKLITLTILHEIFPNGTHFTAESTEAMLIKYLAQGNNILLPRFEPSFDAVHIFPAVAGQQISRQLCCVRAGTRIEIQA